MKTFPKDDVSLDSVQLNELEHSFRTWANDSKRKDVRLSRTRILFFFLLIRNTGAKLNEVLSLNPFEDIDIENQAMTFSSLQAPNGLRQVPLSKDVCEEIRMMLSDPDMKDVFGGKFAIDPAFVRKKFYERAKSCGFPKHLGGPEMIRKARAVELLKNNMPFPAVQSLLGHAGFNQISTYVTFSPDEVQQAAKLFLERESSRKTSARNSFFCKIQDIVTGDIQARVTMVTIEGQIVTTVVTTDSVHVLGLEKGTLVTAEVKAPWIDVYSGETEPRSSAENRYYGEIIHITRGRVNTEFIIRVSANTELCAIVSSDIENRISLKEGDKVWAFFNCFAVVLHRE